MHDTTVPAGEFKARCLQLLDEVAATGHALTITRRGRPVARVVPMPPERSLYGALAGSVEVRGDIVGRERREQRFGDDVLHLDVPLGGTNLHGPNEIVRQVQRRLHAMFPESWLAGTPRLATKRGSHST